MHHRGSPIGKLCWKHLEHEVVERGMSMEFEHSEKVRALQPRVEAFMVEHIYPNEEELFAEVNEGDRWQPLRLLESFAPVSQGAGGKSD